MNRHRLLLSLFIFVECAALLQADAMANYDKVDGRGLSVYRIVPAIDAPVLGIAAAGAAVPLFFESSLVHPRALGNSHDINSIDRTVVGNHNSTVATLSHVTVAFALATPLALDLKEQGWNRVLAEDFVVYAEVLSINSAFSNIARYSVQRPRPDVYRPGADVHDPGEFLSFYSGHTASTFAALSAASMTYGYRYGPAAWPWAVTLAVGTGVAAQRIVAGRHYYSDNLVGAMMGTGIGITVPMLHHRKVPSQLTIVPADRGAQIVWHKDF